MKKGMLTIFCLFVVSFLTAQTALEITEKVADNVLQNTSFRLIDKKSGETFSSTKEIPYNHSVSVESAENGWKGLLTKIKPDGQVLDICVGTGIEDNIKFYYDRPTEHNDLHGLGAVILAGTEMMKAEQKK